MITLPRLTPQIRPAQPADATALATLARALLTHEQSINALPFQMQPWAASPEELRKQLQEPNTRFFVAEANERLVGYLKVTLHGFHFTRAALGWPQWIKTWLMSEGRRWFDKLFKRPRGNVALVGGYIAGAYVLPEWRRSHVGRALVNAAENWMCEIGMPTSELHVLYANENAREFWASLGYEPLALSLRKKLG